MQNNVVNCPEKYTQMPKNTKNSNFPLRVPNFALKKTPFYLKNAFSRSNIQFSFYFIQKSPADIANSIYSMSQPFNTPKQPTSSLFKRISM